MSSYSKIDKHAAEGNARRILGDRATYEHGTKGQLPSFYRYVVLDVIFDPQIIDKDKIDYWEHSIGVSNMEWAAILPRNTIIGQRIFEGNEESPMFLFPFFPSHIAMPCKPGEHVWVMFEAPGNKDHTLGYWFCKITEPNFVDDVNHTHAPRVFEPSFVPGIKELFNGTANAKFEFRNGRADEQDGVRYTVADSTVVPGNDELIYEKLLSDSDASKVMSYESVPRYRKRPGDLVLEGTNNSLIVLGTDRTSSASDLTNSTDPKKGIIPSKVKDDIDGHSGTIDIVVGRGQTKETGGEEVTSTKIDGSDFKKELDKSANKLKSKEGDVDLKKDRSRIYVSMKTKPDKNFGLDKVLNSIAKDVKDSSTGNGAIVQKSDKIRLIARQDVVILVAGTKDNEKDDNGNIKDAELNVDNCASIIVRANGDIIFNPAKHGVIKLGGDDAKLAVLCTSQSTVSDGNVTAKPIIDTMGGAQGANDGLNGVFSTKVLLK